MARGIGDTGQAAVLDAAQVKRLLKIAGTTIPFQGDMTVITLSYWLGLRAKELASLKVGDVYGSEGGVKQVLHLKAGYTKRSRTRDVYLSSDEIRKRLKEYWLFCLNPPCLRRSALHGLAQMLVAFACPAREGGVIRLT